MAEFCAGASDRFLWSPSVPLQDIPTSVAELKRSATVGGRGVNIGTDASVHRLDDPSMSPFYEALAEEDMAIFIHPHPKPMAKGRMKSIIFRG